MVTATFIIYLLIVLALGVVAWWMTTNLADYILGGRRLGPGVTALSAQASDMSGWLLLGLPGLAYRAGLAAVWMPLGLLIGTYLNWRLVAPRLREATQRLGNALTIPDYLEARFEDRTRLLRTLASVAILVFLTLYVGSGLAAGGVLFEAVFDIDYFWAVTAGAAAILVYTAIGGFLAVSWTDTFQGLLMLVALLAAGITGLWYLGGFEGSAQAVRDHDPLLLDWMVDEDGLRLGVIGIASAMAWGLGYFGQPHILVRFMAIREPADLPRARRMAMLWVTLALGAAVAVGVLGAGYLGPQLLANGDGGADRSEQVFMVLVEALFHPVIAGACLAAILAAIMSTADSQLLVASSAVSQDLYRGLLRRSAGRLELMWVGRLAVVAIALAAYATVTDGESRVLDLVAYAWAGFGATFGPVLLVSLWWPRMSRAAAVAGIVVGGGMIFVWRWLRGWSSAAADRVGRWLDDSIAGILDVSNMGVLDPLGARLSDLLVLYELLPAFVLSLAAIVVATWLWPRPTA